MNAYVCFGGETRDGERHVVSRSALRRAIAVEMGHAAGIALVRKAMEIDWMTRDEITQAIPPVYTHFIGEALLRAMGLP